MPRTYYAPALNIALQTARSQGMDVDLLLRKLAIDPRQINDPNTRLQMDQVLQFFQGIDEQFPETALGLQAYRFWHPSTLGVLGCAWMTSKNLHAAFTRLCRFSRIVSDGASIEMLESDASVTLRMHFQQQGKPSIYRMDATMAVLLAMTQAYSHKDMHPLQVMLAHSRPANAEPYITLFQCPVDFDGAVCEFTVSREDAYRPNAPTSAKLEQLHDRLMLEYLAELDEENILERVKALVIAELPSGKISDEQIAQSLNMTVRTLQRRLKEHDSSFKSLLAEVRTQLAEQYLRQGKNSLAEISFLLGFSEQSAFSRAFKRWKGKSPTQYRMA